MVFNPEDIGRYSGHAKRGDYILTTQSSCSLMAVAWMRLSRWQLWACGGVFFVGCPSNYQQRQINGTETYLSTTIGGAIWNPMREDDILWAWRLVGCCTMVATRRLFCKISMMLCALVPLDETLTKCTSMKAA